MRLFISAIALALVSSMALAANKDITLHWNPPTLRSDNVTPLPASELDHYTVYTDQCVPGGPFYKLLDRPASIPTTMTIANMPPGTCRYKVTAVDTLLQEGPVSSTVTVVIAAVPPPPAAPTSLTATVSP